MAQTVGSSSAGKRSRFKARTLGTICAHCQSKFADEGKPSSACHFVSVIFRSSKNPNMRLQAGYIWRFQKMGTMSSGGQVQSRSELRGLNKTSPPAANLFSASSQELVTRTSAAREGGQGCGTAALKEGD